ncbi:hypothetical protein RI054_23g100690 [Pseudoscourfieldia marina]
MGLPTDDDSSEELCLRPGGLSFAKVAATPTPSSTAAPPTAAGGFMAAWTRGSGANLRTAAAAPRVRREPEHKYDRDALLKIRDRCKALPENADAAALEGLLIFTDDDDERAIADDKGVDDDARDWRSKPAQQANKTQNEEAQQSKSQTSSQGPLPTEIVKAAFPWQPGKASRRSWKRHLRRKTLQLCRRAEEEGRLRKRKREEEEEEAARKRKREEEEEEVATLFEYLNKSLKAARQREREEEAAARQRECNVCFDEMEDGKRAVLSCGHAKTCYGCALRLWDTTRECPECRQNIRKKPMRVYL